MSVLLIILTFVGAVAALLTRALAIDEVKGRIQRRITAHLDATIAGLPDELQAEWAEEWRADLAMVITMPLTATQFVRDVRRITGELVAERAFALTTDGRPASARSTWASHVTQGFRMWLAAAACVASTGGVGEDNDDDRRIIAAHDAGRLADAGVIAASAAAAAAGTVVATALAIVVRDLVNPAEGFFVAGYDTDDVRLAAFAAVGAAVAAAVIALALVGALAAVLLASRGVGVRAHNAR